MGYIKGDEKSIKGLKESSDLNQDCSKGPSLVLVWGMDGREQTDSSKISQLFSKPGKE